MNIHIHVQHLIEFATMITLKVIVCCYIVQNVVTSTQRVYLTAFIHMLSYITHVCNCIIDHYYGENGLSNIHRCLIASLLYSVTVVIKIIRNTMLT